jgi:trypsin-like peptidase
MGKGGVMRRGRVVVWGVVVMGLLVVGQALFGEELPPPVPIEVGSIALSTHGGFGHACPISAGLALTARHVIDPRPFDPETPLQPGRWNDEDGHEGIFLPLNVARDRDLGLITGEFPHWYEIAKAPPKRGERLRIVGFEWQKKGRFLAPKVWTVEYLRQTGGMLIVSENPDSGSSGSCVLNEAGEVVGIEVWGFEVNGLKVGGVVKVVGEGFKAPEKEE